MYAEAGKLSPPLLETLERIAAEFPNQVWGVKSALLLSRMKQDEERRSATLVTELKARTRQALSSCRVQDALAAIDEMRSTASPAMAEALASERSAVLSEMPLIYARVRSRAEIAAASGDFAAACIEYGRVIDGFPPGEWVDKATAAVSTLREIEERRAAQAADEERRRRDHAERSTYEAVIRKAYDAASSFKYDDAAAAVEQGFAAMTDASLKQGLAVYREIIRAEKDFFEACSGRLSRGEIDIQIRFSSEEKLTVLGIGGSGVALRSEKLEHVVYPWKNVDDFQKFRLFDEYCARKGDALETLALAAVAFHRGLFVDAENKLGVAANLNRKLAEKSHIWRGFFNEYENITRPVRARSIQRQPGHSSQ